MQILQLYIYASPTKTLRMQKKNTADEWRNTYIYILNSFALWWSRSLALRTLYTRIGTNGARSPSVDRARYAINQCAEMMRENIDLITKQCVTSATLCVNIDNVIDLYQVYIDICIYIDILLMINVKVCVSVWWYPGQKQRPQRHICIRHQHKFAFYHILCAVCHVSSCRTINTADMRNMYQ